MGNVTCTGTASPVGILCEYDVSVGAFALLEVINNLASASQVLFITSNDTYSDTLSVTETTITLLYQPAANDYANVSNGTATYLKNLNSSGSLIKDVLAILYPEALSITETKLVSGGGTQVTLTAILRTIGASTAQVTVGTNDAVLVAQATVTSTLSTVTESGRVTTASIDRHGIATSGSWELQVYSSLVGQTLNIPYDATPASLRLTLLSAIPQATSITVTGSAATNYTIIIKAPFTVTLIVTAHGLIGSSSNVSYNLERAYESSPNERQLFLVENGNATGGGYVDLSFNGESATWYWSSGDLWGALQQMPSLAGNIVVRPFPTSASALDREIEFTGALAGSDVGMIGVTSHLGPVPDQNAPQTALWSKLQQGTNGASVTITELQDGSIALGEQDLIRVANNPHFGTYSLSVWGATTPGLQYNASVANDAALEALTPTLPGNVVSIGSLVEGLLFTFAPALGVVNLSGANIDLSNSRFSILELIPGGIINPKELQRSAGKNHFDDPLNWRVVDTGDSRVPDSQDEPIFETGRVPVLYGLQQRSQFIVDLVSDEIIMTQQVDFRVGQKLMLSTTGTLPAGLATDQLYVVGEFNRDTSRLTLEQNGIPVSSSDLGTGIHTIRLAVDALTHYSRFTAPIGLPHFNPAGYQEYLPTALVVGLAPAGKNLITIGEGNGSASGRIRINVGDDATLIEIHKTGGATENGVPSLTIDGTNDQNQYEQFDGDVGLGFFEGEEFRFAKLRVHSGSLFYGRIVSSANCEFRNLGGTIDGRDGQITGKIASKP